MSDRPWLHVPEVDPQAMPAWQSCGQAGLAATGDSVLIHCANAKKAAVGGTGINCAHALQAVGTPGAFTVAPATGVHTATTAVTITGTKLNQATSVMFGANPATNVVVVSDKSITCLAPTQALAGAQNVVVNTPHGNQTLANGFTYS
jgi:hypothetical protein